MPTPTPQNSARRRIPAVFFTYDQDQETALFTLRSYLALWPGLPLDFVIPYTSQAALEAYQSQLPSDLPCTFVRTESAIAAALSQLIGAVLLKSDSPWFFWCTSDRIPIAFADPPRLCGLSSLLLPFYCEFPLDAVWILASTICLSAISHLDRGCGFLWPGGNDGKPQQKAVGVF